MRWKYLASIQASANREAGVSRHHGGRIRGTPETPLVYLYNNIVPRGSREAFIMPRGRSFQPGTVFASKRCQTGNIYLNCPREHKLWPNLGHPWNPSIPNSAMIFEGWFLLDSLLNLAPMIPRDASFFRQCFLFSFSLGNYFPKKFWQTMRHNYSLLPSVRRNYNQRQLNVWL